MKFHLLFICFVICLISLSCGQIQTLKHRPYSDHQKRELSDFKRYYHSQTHEKNERKVDIIETDSGMFLSIDSNYFEFSDSNMAFLSLFTQNIIPPSFIDNLQVVFRFEEYDYFPLPKSKRRFRFWFRNYSGKFYYVNPNECLIELTNKKANRKTDLKTFIEGSELTFLFSYGLI
jgi:hypothetical protein